MEHRHLPCVVTGRLASLRILIDRLATGRVRPTGGLANEAGPTAIMCAEAVWWRCHRSLIADCLKARGVEVLHILGANKVDPHPYTPAARIVNGDLNYEAESLL